MTFIILTMYYIVDINQDEQKNLKEMPDSVKVKVFDNQAESSNIFWGRIDGQR